MSAELPLWFGRERGTDLFEVIDFEADDALDEGGGLLDSVGAGLLGFLAPLAVIALVIAAGQLSVGAMVVLAMAGAAWLTAGLVAAWLVAFSEEAPPWARATVAVLVALGTIIGWAFVVASVVLLLVIVLMVVFGLASDRR
jgi:hypothetical protein